MLYEFIISIINDYVIPFLQDKVILYLILSLLYYLIGGVDETVITLFIVHFLYIVIVLLVYKRLVNILNILKIYIIIAIGNIIDNMMCFQTTSLRHYLILYYTYNNIIDMINILVEDGNICVPQKLKDILKKMKKE